ncbi:aminoacyl-tRNA hydrolase [Gallibacterium trehalosifermentans]|uniref:Peptidyl-tRNA hydrolase n=1 Tax=Gallibacterium trehalosifermentans TaxID=516935 RepID=A0ABV6H1C0_9PAST
MAKIKLIVGLGNPGNKYSDTRHNAGEWLIERLARRFNVNLKEENKFFGKTAMVTIAGQDVRLLVPTTFMNLSGKSVGALATFYRILPEEILVIHDELDLPPGSAKLKLGGGHGGHNGLKDIIAQLANSKNFYRLRLGIGHPGDKNLVAGYVLSKASPQDQQLIDQALDEAERCVEILIKEGIDKAMNRLNGFHVA